VIELSHSVTEAIDEARARVRVGYAWWLRPFLARDVIAITLGRTIHVSAAVADRPREKIEALLRHELAHVRQVNRYGLIGFLVRYAAEFVRHLWRVRSIDGAYALISFEIEACAAESDAERTVL